MNNRIVLVGTAARLITLIFVKILIIAMLLSGFTYFVFLAGGYELSHWWLPLPFYFCFALAGLLLITKVITAEKIRGNTKERVTMSVDEYDLSWHLEQAVQELDADSIGLAHNMGGATLEQLHEIVAFAERLKEGALAEMYLREREANGEDAQRLVLPPKGYTGYRPKR